MESPIERARRLNAAHAAAPIALHRDILYGELCINGERLVDLVDRCLADSQLPVSPHKYFHRPLSSYFLAQYFLYARSLPGDQAECGVFQGTSALLLCRTAAGQDASYRGGGLHLVDSFEGLAKPADEDRFDVLDARGERTTAAIKSGGFAATIDTVRATLREFPDVSYHRGWIPDVLTSLPSEAGLSFTSTWITTSRHAAHWPISTRAWPLAE